MGRAAQRLMIEVDCNTTPRQPKDVDFQFQENLLCLYLVSSLRLVLLSSALVVMPAEP